MTISSMHTHMELLSAVLMGLNGGFTLGSSHTLLTILKSMSFWSPVCCVLIHGCFCRILLATIQDQGLCPCLHCLVSKSKTDKLDLVEDMKTCVEKACKYLADMVNEAQKAIYNLRLPIGGVATERLLKPTSSVPTKVSHQLDRH
jgi:hypothetical protein